MFDVTKLFSLQCLSDTNKQLQNLLIKDKEVIKIRIYHNIIQHVNSQYPQ